MNPAAQKPALPVSSAELSSLIHELYATVTGPSKLTDFLERCCTFIGARLGSIVVWEMRTNTVRYVDACLLPRDAHEQYQRQYYATDPIKQALTLHPPRRFYLRHELVSDEEVRAHPYFTEWYKLLGYDDVCSAAIPLNEHYRCHLGFTRNIGDPPFTRQETDFLDLLLPHIERSLVLFNMLDRLTLMSDLAQEHLAQAGAGFIVLSEEGRVTYMNRIARAMLASGPVIHEQEGLIRIDDPQAQRRFSTMVRECIAVSKRPNMMTGGAVSVPRPDGPALGIMVLPYRTHATYLRTTSDDSRRATVTLFDPARPRLDPPAILRQLYRLSASEVQVCWRLANGETLEEIATSLNIGKETVRSQLKRIFVKTGTSRQSELVRLVLVGPALWATVPSSLMQSSHSVSAKSNPFGSVLVK
ncbi:MAG: helix-turn-helix transcriptional regulator [Gammaproteobacteria bacterium]|nr:helix-turn-helix transcriptional regulator [Gammaproteobacteria bacterium]MBK9665072.1 helix-turn-helix transcriptional regulator [Gammaproteobacteria bacterium]